MENMDAYILDKNSRKLGEDIQGAKGDPRQHFEIVV